MVSKMAHSLHEHLENKLPEEAKGHRLPVMVATRMAREIDEYRWRNRVRSQAEAVRQLIKEGLRAKAAETSDSETNAEQD